MNKQPSDKMIIIIMSLLALPAAALTVLYFGGSPASLYSLALFALTVLIIYKAAAAGAPRRINSALAVFSLALGLVIVLGRHIYVTDAYNGTIRDNYILPYTLLDPLALALIACEIYILLSAALHFLAGREGLLSAGERPWSPRLFLLFAAIMLAAWLPYLLVYFPGFYFPDSSSSVRQAFGIVRLRNNHPVIYTLFIKLCLFLGGAFRTGDITLGCLIYSLLQMLFISLSFSYMFSWIRTNSHVREPWIWLGVLAFALSPYLAQNAVAMWKDPVFSAGVTVYSLLLAELCVTEGAAFSRRKWRLSFLLISAVVLFWRNNGFSAVLGALIALSVIFLRSERGSALRRSILRAGFLALMTFMLWYAVTGPVFSALGMGKGKEEDSGLMLNQMARVAAYEGEMSAEEREYLGELFPIDEYENAYRPCCVDLLKWDDRLNYDAYYRSDFYKTWLSLLFKNPRIYFEAWELETYGFWSINCDEIVLNRDSIGAGGAYNLREGFDGRFEDHSISLRNLLGADIFRRIFPANSWSVPLGPILWFMLFICLALRQKKKGVNILALAPQLGIFAGLLVASPIWYLPRYGAAAQFLLPLYILLLLA